MKQRRTSVVNAAPILPPPHAAVIILIATPLFVIASPLSTQSSVAFQRSFTTPSFYSTGLHHEHRVRRRRERRINYFGDREEQRHFFNAQHSSRRKFDLTLTSLFFEEERIIVQNNGDNQDNDKTDANPKTTQQFSQIYQTLSSPPRSYSISKSNSIISQLQSSGFTNDDDIYQFAVGFVSSNRQEIISRILIDDFAWPVMDAHVARVGMSALVLSMMSSSTSKHEQTIVTSAAEQPPSHNTPGVEVMLNYNNNNNNIVSTPLTTLVSTATTTTSIPLIEESRIPWKSVHVNDGAKIRRANTSSSLTTSRKNSYKYNYGMANTISDCTTYCTLSHELTEFYNYMTLQRTGSTSATSGTTTSGSSIDNHVVIRDQTAKVYMTHARLFLGWIVDARGVLLDDDDKRKILEQEVGGIGREVDQEVISLEQTSSPMKKNVVQCVRKLMWSNVLQRISSSSSSTSLSNPMLEHKGNEEERMQSLTQSLSLYDIFPNPMAESVSPILQYVLWLRNERGISQNHEANILRGMIKLVKFRFANDNACNDGGGNTIKTIMHQQPLSSLTARRSLTMTSSLDDLPIVLELRKLHRDAGNKGKKAPRSSDEDKKWLDWTEYLKVIRLLKSDLSEMIETYDEKTRLFDGGLNEKDNDIDTTAATVTKLNEEDVKKSSSSSSIVGVEVSEKKIRHRQSSSDAARAAMTKSLKVLRHEIAKTYQQYLILSFFACIPDRQRTFRELVFGKNFFKVDNNDHSNITATTGSSSSSSMWIIKHTADDYKTGATYGERPSLPLTASLTLEIDDFIERWRPSLLHVSSSSSSTTSTTQTTLSSSHLFLQPRTGKPLTANSIYQIVSRCCYKYKQKKTNPHLLRDMIVTHIRQNSDASEKELEALALFMGHSIQMQRNSYDRRTLGQKVSPAIKLMHDMNNAALRE